MSAEGKPPAESSYLEQGLAAGTRLVLRFPVSTIVGSALLAAVCLVWAQIGLNFRTSRTDLLNPKSAHNRRWAEYVAEFGEQDDVIVVVHSRDDRGTPEKNRQVIIPVLDEVAAAVTRQSNYFKSVFHKFDTARLRAKGLYYLEPRRLQEIEGFLEQAGPVLQGRWEELNIGGQLAWFAGQLEHGDPRQIMAAGQAQQAESLRILAAALSQPGPYQSPLPEIVPPGIPQDPASGGYVLANGDREGILSLYLIKSDRNQNFVEYADSLAALRRIVAETKMRHPEAWVGLTGMPVMENDEMEASQSAMTQAGVLSFIGVGLLYIAGFGCVRHPMMALVALLVPMAWSFGYIIMTVGHLNILSSSFATIVIGLGSDYGVYHIAQYLRLCDEGMKTHEALVETARSIGPGLTSSAAATALAFFAIGLNDFPGIAELGIIAGGGIMLCWLASLTTLPALIHRSDAKRPTWKVPAPLDVYSWMRPLTERPYLFLTLYLLLTAFLALGVSRLWYDHNLLNLQAANLESVELEKQLLRKNDFSSNYAISIARTREEVVQRKAMFLDRNRCPMIDSVKEIATVMPTDIESKRPTIERMRARLANLPGKVQPIPVVPPEVLDRALGRLQQFMMTAGQNQQGQSLGQLRELLRMLPKQEYFRRVSAFQDSMAADMLGRLQALQASCDPDPPRLDDLPPGLVARFVGQHGYYAMQICTKADIWNMDDMEKFVRQVRSVDPAATGNPIQIYESSREMKLGYEKGALYGIFLVILVVYLDFRSIRMTMLAILPLVTSKLQLFGLMGWLDIPLNPANMIVLPLILGIGVDTGVQVVHDYLREPYPYRMCPATAAAIVVNTLMNIVGFGGLMIATHRGLHSLGRVLTLGMAACLLSGLVMPSLLRVLPNMKPDREAPPALPPRLDAGVDLSLSSQPRTRIPADYSRRHPVMRG